MNTKNLKKNEAPEIKLPPPHEVIEMQSREIATLKRRNAELESIAKERDRCLSIIEEILIRSSHEEK
jgi:hypothetical protein